VEPFRFVYGTQGFRGAHFGNRWTTRTQQLSLSQRNIL